MNAIFDMVIQLTEYVCVLMVVVYLLTRTEVYAKIEKKQVNAKARLMLILLFGMLSIYGTLSGISILGAVANTRDLGPGIAGMLGGPLAGMGAGIIGATHRFLQGGFTAVPCSVATILAGLAGGIIFRFRKEKFISPLKAVVFAALYEVFHMILVLALSGPFYQAVELVKQISIPMIIGNAFGLGMFSFIIRNYRQEQEVKQAKERIESELKIAHDIQISMLPRIFPPFPNRKEFDIFAVMDPAKDVGGDFYDFFLIGEKKLGFLVADVSGKGVPAALFMVITKTLIHNEAMKGDSPHEILTRVNSLLVPENDTCMFATVFFCILDYETGIVEYANAGHNPPLLYRAGGVFDYFAVNKGFVLGPMPGIRLKTEKIQLNRGDIIFLYTDGVTEAMDPSDKLFSGKRLHQFLNRKKPDSIIGLINDTRKEIADYARTAPQSDDITIFALKYLGKR